MLAGTLAVAALLMFAQGSARVAALLPRLAAPRLPGLLEEWLCWGAFSARAMGA